MWIFILFLPSVWASDLIFHNFDPLSASAQRGLLHLYAGDILAVKGGIPVSLLRRTENLPSGRALLSNLQSPEYQWLHYGAPPSPPERRLGGIDPGKSLPVSLSAHPFLDPTFKEERSVVTNTCLACHTSILDNQVIAGTSNNQAYFPPIIDDMKKVKQLQWFLKVNPIWNMGTSSTEKSFLKIAIDYFDIALFPMLKWQKSRGAITGPASVLTYLTRMTTNMNSTEMADSLRYDTQKIIEKDMKESPYTVPPVKAHPWWTVKYKPTLYRYPEKRENDLAVTAQYFMDRHIGVSKTLAPLHLPIVIDVLQFVTEMRSPRYPRPLDPDKVAEGERLFHEKPISKVRNITCAGCHGSYRK